MPIYDSMPSMIEAAETGDLEAQHNVGACYAAGDWDGPKDEAEAIKWYTRAAHSGHAMSQYGPGFMLISGEGADKDVGKGMWRMRQAAGDGEGCAGRLPSGVYQEGLYGVGSDLERAKYWEERSALSEGGI